MVMPNVRFGSQADLKVNITPTAASGGKADVQKLKLQNPNLNVCFHQERSFRLLKIRLIEGRLSARSGR